MRHLITTASLLLLAACASEQPVTVASADGAAAPAAAASQPKVYCHREKIMGSNMTETVCEPAKLDNDGAKAVLQEWRNQSAITNPPRAGGGN